MIIVRDGKEIELTADELRDAFYECRHKFDLEDLNVYMDVLEDTKYVRLANRFRYDPDFADRVAYRYRKYLDGIPEEDEEWNIVIGALTYIDEFDSRGVTV